MGFTIVFTARGVRETERPVSFIPKGALTHHPQAGGGTACGSRALSEGDFAFCGKRQTMPQHFPGAAALSVQAEVWYESYRTSACLREICQWQFSRSYGVAKCDPIFF